MWFLFALAGGIAGAAVAPYRSTFFGMLTGAVLGLVFGRLASLARENALLAEKIERLEKLRIADRVNSGAQATVTEPEPEDAPDNPWLTARDATPPAPAAARKSTATKPVDTVASAAKPRAAASSTAAPADEPSPWRTSARDGKETPQSNATPDFAQRLLKMATRWLSTGNVPVKIGVIVSFFGVAFLLKYAVDRIDMVVPLGVRYLLVAAVSGGVFAIGWRLRQSNRVYALSLQGGAIGALYLTIFAAFRLHPLLPATLAFALMVVLTAVIGWLAVRQDALALAVLGTVGGFLAPVLISTGSGDHVTLFGYYLLLNAAILGIAWHKTWRSLNLLGFAFTFGIATLWGGQYYQPEYFASTEPFLVAFFLFYHAIAILYALRQPHNLRGIVDGTLVFGTPGVAFALQSALLADSEYGLAISACLLAGLYAATVLWLRGLNNPLLKMLINAYVALAVAFATLAVPLALDDRWTAVAWALEGTALIWLGVQQARWLTKLSGTALLLASGVAYLGAGWSGAVGLPVLNGGVLSGVLISLMSLWSAYHLERDAKPEGWQPAAVFGLFAWGLTWWFGIGLAEGETRIDGTAAWHGAALFIALSAAGLALAGSRLRWTLALQTTFGLLPAMGVLALFYVVIFEHLLAGPGSLAWLALFAAHFLVLKLAGDAIGKPRVVDAWHYAGALLIAACLSLEAGWQVERVASDVWAISGALGVLIAAALAVTKSGRRLDWPLQRHADAYVGAAASAVALTLIALAVVGVRDPGDPAPLAYLPVLNPFDVLTAAALMLALSGLSSEGAMSRWLDPSRLHIARRAWLAVAFVLTTIAVVRMVHHVGNVPWQERVLMRSIEVQSSLTIYWAILGIGGMIAGVRRASRETWVIGAGMMLFVVVKLLLVDMGSTGTLARVVSFLGVGAMLLVVGYFAPAPPKQAEGVDVPPSPAAADH